MDAQPRRHRMRHRHMRHAALAEKRALAFVGAVDELVDQHEGARRKVLLERATGGERDEIGNARALKHVDVGAIVDVGGWQPMALVVARQEHDRQSRDLADAQRRRRLAPWALDLLLAYVLEARQIVDAGAANDAKHRFGHEPRSTAARPTSARKASLTREPRSTPSSW